MVSPHPDEMEAQALAAWQPDDPDTPDYYDEELRRAHEWPHVAKEMAHTIDPTAEVGCWYGDADYPYDWVLEQYYGGEVPPRPLDPVCMYYARAPLPEPLSRYGKWGRQNQAFGRWIWFGDLSEAVRNALWEKHREALPGPARQDKCGQDIERSPT